MGIVLFLLIIIYLALSLHYESLNLRNWVCRTRHPERISYRTSGTGFTEQATCAYCHQCHRYLWGKDCDESNRDKR